MVGLQYAPTGRSSREGNLRVRAVTGAGVSDPTTVDLTMTVGFSFQFGASKTGSNVTW
jgi:hypothetical protein